MSTETTADFDDLDDEPTPLRKLLEGIERARRLAAFTVVVFATGTGLAWAYSQRAFDLLALPLTRELAARGQDPRLVFTGLTDPFILYFSLSLFGGLLVASPMIAAMLFVALSGHIRNATLGRAVAFVTFAVLLGAAGIAFAYFVLIPFAVAYLLEVGSEFETAVTVREFLTFTLRLMVAMAAAAQLPLASFTAARFGLVTGLTMWRMLRYAVLMAFLLGAWLTPPDVISQLLVAGPLIALYLVGVLVAALASRQR
jgi:sec-independent protein translocase protein TatC